MKKTKSIKFKIITIYIISLLGALAITSALGYYKSRDILVANLEETLTSLAVSSSNEVGLWLDGRKGEISSLAGALQAMPVSSSSKLSFLSSELKRTKLYETYFIVDDKGNYVITSGTPGNVSDRDYYKRVMGTGQAVVSDPVVSRATGKSVIVVGAPLLKDEKVVGMLGGTVTLEDISQRIAAIKVGKTGYAYMVQGDGLVIAHPNRNMVMNSNLITDSGNDPSLRDAMMKVTRGEKGISRYKFEGVDKYVAFNPVPGVNWGIAVTEPVDELSAQLASLPVFAFIVAVVITIITVTASNLIMARLISRPIDRIKELMARAEQGDLAVRGQYHSGDEIGQLTHSFNQFMDKTQQVIRNIHENSVTFHKSLEDMFDTASSMAATSQEMDAKTGLASDAIKQITAGISETASATSDLSNRIGVIASAAEEMSSTIQRMASAAEQISANLDQVSGVVDHISGSTNSVFQSARDVSSSVSSVATAVKEINISLNEVSSNCERSILITDEAETRARDTREIISKLNNSSRQIGKIVNVINDIAEQTNMLALNAAIEAAGAGDAGRGFAVVANEVKELARQTADATEEISQQIEAMQNNMMNAVKAVETITGVIEEITGITNTIASAVAEQSSTTGEISKSVILAAEKVNLITREFATVASNTQQAASNLAEVSKGAQEIARSSSELSMTSNEVAENTLKASDRVAIVAQEASEISSRANEVAQSIEEISLASAETAAGAETTINSASNLSQMFQKIEGLSRKFRA